MVGNNPIGWIDILGLAGEACFPCKTPGAKKETDDAGVDCCSDEIETIMLKSDHGLIGHTFLEFGDGYSPGYFPAGGVLHGPGTIRNTPGREYDVAKPYKACPSSAQKIRDSIAKNSTGTYDLWNNDGGKNCTGWALCRLGDGGFQPPISGDTSGLDPNDIR